MKHKLYKFASLTVAGVVVVSMGACKKNIQSEDPHTETSITQEEMHSDFITTNIAITEPTTIKIFDDYELESEVENLTEKQTLETISEEPYTELTTMKSTYISRFSSQEELENYLEQIYIESEKNSLEIIQEDFGKQENGDYYAYRTDLSAAAAYKIITEKGYSLEDVQDELDYVLACRINPGEITDIEELALAKLITIFQDYYTLKDIFQICEQLALELHLVSCPNKEVHSEKYGWVSCEELDKDKIFYKIIDPTPHEELTTKKPLIRMIF